MQKHRAETNMEKEKDEVDEAKDHRRPEKTRKDPKTDSPERERAKDGQKHWPLLPVLRCGDHRKRYPREMPRIANAAKACEGKENGKREEEALRPIFSSSQRKTNRVGSRSDRSEEVVERSMPFSPI